MDNKQIIINFLEEMSGQDNRCTTFPYYYVIRDYEYIPTSYEYSDRVEYFHEDDSAYEAPLTEADYEKLPEEEYYDKNEDSEELGYQEQYEPCYQLEKEVYKGMFLTESDAKNHLKMNYYHYSGKADTYVMAVWRAPELEQFLTAIFEHFDKPIPPGKYYEKKDKEVANDKSS